MLQKSALSAKTACPTKPCNPISDSLYSRDFSCPGFVKSLFCDKLFFFDRFTDYIAELIEVSALDFEEVFEASVFHVWNFLAKFLKIKTIQCDIWRQISLIISSHQKKSPNTRSNHGIVHDCSSVNLHFVRLYSEVTSLLRPDDILVINDTRDASTYYRAHHTAKWYKKKRRWMSFSEIRLPMCGDYVLPPGERLKIGRTIILENSMTLEIVGRDLRWQIGKSSCASSWMARSAPKIRRSPTSSYITEHLTNSELYQTVYAENLGSTGGTHSWSSLHPWTPSKKIKAMWVKIAHVTLHIGPGTFKPIYEDDVTQYQIHSEFVTIPRETIELLNNRKGRLIAVGTTSMRSSNPTQ